MHSHGLKWMSRALVLACLTAAPLALMAQDAPQPAKPAAKASSSENGPSKWDIFAGYSYLAPKGTVITPMGQGVPPVPVAYKSDNLGFIGSVSRFVNNYVGGQIEASTHETMRNSKSTNDSFTSIGVGPIFRFPTEEITPFVHALVGGAYVAGPNIEGTIDHLYTWGPEVTAGGGMDYSTPLFNHHLAIRLFQADFQYMHVNFGTHPTEGGRANIKAARLSAGFVYHIGTIAPPPQLTVACSANPASVFPGEPVNLTATLGSQDPKSPSVVYGWSGDGVKGNGANATVDTANLAPGQHTVKCDAKEGKAGKEGLKPWQVANEGTATFTVKEFEPPTISCSANPTTLKPGDSSTITATGVSPQNRPLTYSYSASGGTVNGNGASATYSSTGAPTGPVTITCNVSDDKGHSASSTTSVNIEAPPPPPQPHAQALCSITFSTDKRRPTRVDNEAKACLDQVALSLQNQADAKAVVVGESTAKEKEIEAKQQKFAARHKRAKVENFAAERAVNAKEYLVTDKGIDASRISAATGSGDDQKVENYLVPAGANFNQDVTGTTPVDESTVKPEVRKDLPQRHHAHHKPAAK